MKLNKEDKELIKIATIVVKSNCDLYETDKHVACALLAKSGNIYKGMNLYTSHSVCAEQVALGQAFANNERKFKTIVAVRMLKDGSTTVIAPCGLCRYIFDKLGLDLYVIVPDEEGKQLVKVKASTLLPYQYKR